MKIILHRQIEDGQLIRVWWTCEEHNDDPQTFDKRSLLHEHLIIVHNISDVQAKRLIDQIPVIRHSEDGKQLLYVRELRMPSRGRPLNRRGRRA